MRRLALLLLLALLIVPSCAMHPMVRVHNCTIWTWDAAPDLVYWPICDD